MKEYKSDLMREAYTEETHASGLHLLFFPKPGFSEKIAILATRFGSVDVSFRLPGAQDIVTVPDGVAHFLEHKLFESESGSAFEEYAKTGAQANAYTSFARTAYHFTCTEHFHESLDILLSFTRKPYFTQESVAKEQGIIGQEIRMYDDSPFTQAMYGAFRAMYAHNEVQRDIAGTTKTIAEITADTLYTCYNAFYNPQNMVLCVCGDVDFDRVRRQVDEHFPEKSRPCAQSVYAAEPPALVEPFVEKRMAVETPLLVAGLKGLRTELSGMDFLRESLYYELCLELLAGQSSPFYREYYEKGLINGSFSQEYNGARSYSFCLFAGESPDPEAVFDGLVCHMERLTREGILPERFERCRRVLLGVKTALYNSVEAIANELIMWYFMNGSLFDQDELLRGVTLPELQAFYDDRFRPELLARSVVRGVGR